jgi:hypothetical protein
MPRGMYQMLDLLMSFLNIENLITLKEYTDEIFIIYQRAKPYLTVSMISRED